MDNYLDTIATKYHFSREKRQVCNIVILSIPIVFTLWVLFFTSIPRALALEMDRPVFISYIIIYLAGISLTFTVGGIFSITTISIDKDTAWLDEDSKLVFYAKEDYELRPKIFEKYFGSLACAYTMQTINLPVTILNVKPRPDEKYFDCKISVEWNGDIQAFKNFLEKEKIILDKGKLFKTRGYFSRPTLDLYSDFLIQEVKDIAATRKEEMDNLYKLMNADARIAFSKLLDDRFKTIEYPFIVSLKDFRTKNQIGNLEINQN